mmetsp:Transcript_28745/g.66749  ORF Transcript_28745/g.66749 Transcript_28745/m.66749 type:complete len:222 (+) Transcript_28745:2528-3193(+)
MLDLLCRLMFPLQVIDNQLATPPSLQALDRCSLTQEAHANKHSSRKCLKLEQRRPKPLPKVLVGLRHAHAALNRHSGSPPHLLFSSAALQPRQLLQLHSLGSSKLHSFAPLAAPEEVLDAKDSTCLANLNLSPSKASSNDALDVASSCLASSKILHGQVPPCSCTQPRRTRPHRSSVSQCCSTFCKVQGRVMDSPQTCPMAQRKPPATLCLNAHSGSDTGS